MAEDNTEDILREEEVVNLLNLVLVRIEGDA